MRCGHCGTIVKVPYKEGCILSEIEDDNQEIGYRVDSGFCPSCNKIIVVLLKGLVEWVEDEMPPSYGNKYPKIKQVIEEKIIYPSTQKWFINVQHLPKEIQREFDECISTLPVSKKASAALSRRLFQRILREKFNIKKDTLAQEIEEFIKNTNVPTYLINAIDAIRTIGNTAAHPIAYKHTGEISEVEEWEAEWLVEILYFLIDFAYIKPAIYEEKIQKINSKLKELGKPLLKSKNS